MKVSYKWLQTYFEKELPAPSVLADLFTFHSFEVEGVENVTTSDGTTDTVIDAKVLPDRAHYALSHRGIAEEIHILTGLPRKSSFAVDIHAAEKIDTTTSSVQATIEDVTFCRRFIARRVEGIDNGPSPAWLVRHLEAIGQKPISLIVDITNFVKFDTGHPLHAFDADKVVGNLVVRRAKQGEQVTLLDKKTVTLTTEDYVVADDMGALDIAGIKGGERAEITSATKNILVIVPNCAPSPIRRTSTKYAIRNESSKRFENEVTPELAMDAMVETTALIAQIAPEARTGKLTDQYPTHLPSTTISLTRAYVNQKLGVVVPQAECDEILKRIGITNSSASDQSTGDQLVLAIPAHRLDLTIPEDIVEEIGRVYGYDNVKGSLPDMPSFVPQPEPLFSVSQKIKSVLVSLGYSEVYLYTFVAKGDITIAYPLASDKGALRTDLVENMHKSLDMNSKNADLLGLDTVKMFEIGSVFTKDNTSNDSSNISREIGREIGGNAQSKETKMLALGISQIKKIKGFDIQKYLQDELAAFAKELGVDVGAGKSTYVAGSKEIIWTIPVDALINQLHVKGVDLGAFTQFAQAPKQVRFKPFSIYPFIVRDIAVFTSATQEAVDVEILKGIADAGATELIARKALFDVFTKALPDGTSKTSFAFRIVFQSFDKTLSDEEVNKIMESVYSRVKEQGWEVR